MIEEMMKANIGKEFEWNGKKVTIVDAYSDFEGDFYKYKFEGEDKIHEIDVLSPEGMDFESLIP
jgi:hypothetical protein